MKKRKSPPFIKKKQLQCPSKKKIIKVAQLDLQPLLPQKSNGSPLKDQDKIDVIDFLFSQTEPTI